MTTCITSLDPTETKSHVLGCQSDAQHRIHRTVWDLRLRTILAFRGHDDLSLQRRADRIAMCCVAPVLCVERGRVPVLSPGRCRDRLCPTCARQRGHVARERIRSLVLKADSVRLITLTQPAASDDLGPAIDRLLAAFAKLRRHAAWKHHVRGGLFVVEVTRGANGQHWHAHLHVIAEGSYMPQKVLADAWSVAIGTPAIVDIRATHSRIGAANYVTKYITKGADCQTWSDHELCGYAMGIHRRRLYGTFGKWHKADPARDDGDEPQKCPRVRVSMSQVIEAMRSNTIDAVETAALLASLGSIARRLVATWLPETPTAELPVCASRFEQLTLFVIELSSGMHEAEPEPPQPPRPDAHTMKLWHEHLV